MFKLTPVTSKIGQGHPSSNLTKTLLRYIHGISFGSMRLIFVELSCLQAKCWRTDGRTDGRTDRQTDGQTNLIFGLVTRNPPNYILGYLGGPGGGGVFNDQTGPILLPSYTAMRFWVTKLNVTDGRTDGQTDRRTGGVAISDFPGLRRRGR